MSAPDIKSKPLPLSGGDKSQAVRLILGLAANPVRIEQDRERDAIARALYEQAIYPDPKVRARLKRAPVGDYAVVTAIIIEGLGYYCKIDNLLPLGLPVRAADTGYSNQIKAHLNWNDHRALSERIRAYQNTGEELADDLRRIERQLTATIGAIKHHADLVAAFPDYAADIRKAIPLRHAADRTALTVPVQSIMCAIAKLQGVERDGCSDIDKMGEKQ